MRAGWLTDIHLNFVTPENRALLYDEIRRQNVDLLLISGDIGEAASVTAFLTEIATAVPIPIYFVLGNHDFYGSSIAEVRERVAAHCASHPRLHWLPAEGVVDLTRETALIGHVSWADGRLANYDRSDVLLTDYFAIDELRELSKAERLEKLQALGDEAAEYLERHARQALERRREVLVLTHVPPFREACWHEGRISNEDYLPHFGCRVVGERLGAVMREHPHSNMTVLCGHTHGGGFARILENLSVRTGGAEYEHPRIQGVLDIR